MKKIALLLFTTVLFVVFSCKKQDPIIQQREPEITKFVFTKQANPTLNEDVEAIINGNEIIIGLYGVEKTNLKAEVTTTAKTISYNGELLDFTQARIISVTNAAGKQVNYNVKANFNTVYLASYEQQQGRNSAVYLKNGEKISLTDQTNLHVSEIGTAIFVKDNDVFVAGTSANLDNGNSMAVYWKNGIKTELASGDTKYQRIAHAKGIKVVGNDIYVIGGIFYPGTTAYGTAVYIPVYWKNGMLTELTDGKSNTTLTSLYVYQNDVYVTGYIQKIGLENYKAVYWKNGTQVLLTDGSRIAVAQALMVINNDIHVVGVDDSFVTHWKNGIKHQLERGMAFGIQHHGNDVYIGGYNETLQATSWKNGEKVKTVSGMKGLGLLNLGANIYLLGYGISNGTQKFYLSLNGHSKAVFIGEMTHIQAEDNANAIFLKEM